MTQKMVVGLER